MTDTSDQRWRFHCRLPFGIKSLWLAIALLSLTFCDRHHSPGTTQELSRNLAQQALTAPVYAEGKIEAAAPLDFYAPDAGTIEQVLVANGQHVRQGQLLFVMEEARFTANEAAALARLKTAESDFAIILNNGTRDQVARDRFRLAESTTDLGGAHSELVASQKLYAAGAVPASEVARGEVEVQQQRSKVLLLERKLGSRYSEAERRRAEASLQAAQLAYEGAAGQHQRARSRAPADGTVYFLAAKPGQSVRPGQLLLRMANLDQLTVRCFVEEQDVPRIARGDAMSLSWEAIPNRHWSSSVASVPSTLIARGVRSVAEITGPVANADRQLLPGASVRVTIQSR